jgi:hypothetical protein
MSLVCVFLSAFQCRGDESGKQWVRAMWLALEFGMELACDEERM